MKNSKIFSSQEVRNIQSGKMTMFSEVLRQPAKADGYFIATNINTGEFVGAYARAANGKQERHIRPDGTEWLIDPYRVGQTIYVRESYVYAGVGEHEPSESIKTLYYKADNNLPEVDAFYNEETGVTSCEAPWVSGARMPPELARILLLITELNCKCCKELTEEEARAHGVPLAHYEGAGIYVKDLYTESQMDLYKPSHRTGYEAMFVGKFGKALWDANMHVFLMTFKIEKKINI